MKSAPARHVKGLQFEILWMLIFLLLPMQRCTFLVAQVASPDQQYSLVSMPRAIFMENPQEPNQGSHSSWRLEMGQSPEMQNIDEDDEESVIIGTLEDGDERLGDAATDFYVLPVEAGQTLMLRYGETDSSRLRCYSLLIYTPDGQQIRAEGEFGTACEIEMMIKGELFIAATTCSRENSYGRYYLQILPLKRPVEEVVEVTNSEEFISVMQQHARSLVKSRRTSWGDEAARRRRLDFDLKRFNPGFLEALILERTNEQRAEYGLPACQYHRVLNECARQHSEEMAALNYFSHESPVAEFSSVYQRIYHVFAFQGQGYGENIGMQSKSGEFILENLSYEKLAQEIMEMWMNSSGHRSTILDPDYTCLGVGCALVLEKGTAHFYYTQDFAME